MSLRFRMSDLPRADEAQLIDILQRCVDEGSLLKEDADEVLVAATKLKVMSLDVPLKDLAADMPEGLQARKASAKLKDKYYTLLASDDFKSAHPDCVKAQEVADKVSGVVLVYVKLLVLLFIVHCYHVMTGIDCHQCTHHLQQKSLATHNTTQFIISSRVCTRMYAS